MLRLKNMEVLLYNKTLLKLEEVLLYNKKIFRLTPDVLTFR
jgi:hypothetical protein